MNIPNLSGMTFGKLHVKNLAPKEGMHTQYVCLCSCGNYVKKRAEALVSGHTKSCGCAPSGETHGQYGTPTHVSWRNMVQRCTDPGATGYERYGGAGITVCERWLKFENFLEDMGDRPEGKTLDRRENDKGYSKENCQWSTRKEQARNRSTNVFVLINGKKLCLKDAAVELGLHYTTLLSRMRRGTVKLEKVT